MPSWDEITPYLERETTARRLTAANVLIALNIAGFAAAAVAAFVPLAALQGLFTFSPADSIRGLRLWQFLTYTFWHPVSAGGASGTIELLWTVLGLALGCWILHARGRELEAEWGWRRLAVIYVASGIYGAVAHALTDELVPLPPASGFIGPVLGLYLVWALKNRTARVYTLFWEVRALTSALILLALAVPAVWLWKGAFPAAVLGAVLAAGLILRLEPAVDGWLDGREQRLAREKFLDEFELKRQVDAILEKISRAGMSGLTAAERRALKRASKLFNSEGADRE